MSNLFAYSTSCRLFDDGGDKLHLFDWDAGCLLCGRHLTGSVILEVTPEWLDEAGGKVCRQCQGKARKILGQNMK